MNNSAFRSLISKTSPSDPGRNGEAVQFKKPMLGSRARSSIPMTPRNVSGYNNRNEFARQVAERTTSDGPPAKRFKSSSAPKGSKLAQGYVDRAATLRKDGLAEGSQDDREKRLKALEEMMKLQQITPEEFETMKADMGIGGDTESTHLVKGLDWKLLERVRRGEDVTKNQSMEEERAEDKSEDVDVEDELEKALKIERKIMEAEDEEQELDNDDAIPQGEPQALTRDEILRRLKESRNVTAAPVKPMIAAPALGDRFKKVAAPEKPSKHKFTEVVNGRRREVLLIQKKDGTTKRKTRWLDPESESKADAQPWGMEVPSEIAIKAAQEAAASAAAEEDDDDIFQGVGADYDPLADIKSDESDEEGLARGYDTSKRMSPPAPLAASNGEKRNYFATGQTKEEDEAPENPMTKDPTILAALKRAADIRRREDKEGVDPESTNPDQDAKQKAFLEKLKERERQDNADLDYGFGESRFGDDDDEEVFVEGDDEDRKKPGRKRGGKKRKGDKNDVKDVMGVLEGRDKK